MTIYKHHFWTGSGATKVILTILETTAEVEYYSHWMGSGLRRYKMQFNHQKLSAMHGILDLHLIEQYVSADSDSTTKIDLLDYIHDQETSESSEEIRDAARQVTFEYLLLPESAMWIQEEGALNNMGAMGYAGWSNTFDLLLWINYAVGMYYQEFRKCDIGEVIQLMDKMKFAKDA
ncbi:MAG TPA: hypothetical protein VHO69_19325 [Phototrophicaceae bacterium]|nr:hypothetical protein [Phototrophicaceae bacterium]